MSLALGWVGALLAGAMEFLDPVRMTDTGMWVWATVLAVAGLLASWVIALVWLRWKDGRRKDA